MFIFMLVNSLWLPSSVADASPSSPRHLQSYSDSPCAKDLKWVGAGLRTGLFRWCCSKSPSILAMADIPQLSLSGRPFFLLPYRSIKWFILVQRNQIRLRRTYFLCVDPPGRKESKIWPKELGCLVLKKYFF